MEAAADFTQQCCTCDASSARCWCVDCNEALCEACVSAHRRVTVTRSHRILNQPQAGSVSTPPIKFCRLHPSEPLKLFCFTCNQLTCRDCQLMAHMNHRYQFVRDTLNTLRKQLEVRVQPIRAQAGKVRQSLLDMETRLQDIASNESNLKFELEQSCSILIQHLKKRMEVILKQAKEVCELERETIQRRIMKMKQLMQNQQSVTEIAEKARNTSDLPALWNYIAQLESQVKGLRDEDLSPCQTMSDMKVVTDKSSLDAILSFGELQVSWVPFSVSQNSNRNIPTASSSSGSTLPQTSITSDSLVPVSSPSTSSSQLCPLSSNVTPTTATCPAPYRGTDSPVPVNCPSTSQKSWSSFNQSNTPVTNTTAVVSSVRHLSSMLSRLEKNSPGQALVKKPVQPVSARLPPSAVQSPVHQVVQATLALKRPLAPHPTQSKAAMLNITQTVYQVACLPSVVPQFPMLVCQVSPGSTCLKQQECKITNVIPGQFSPASVSTKIPPAATTGNKISVGPSQTAPHPPPISIPQSFAELLAPDTDPRRHSFSSLDQQQQSPVVRAVADSACDSSAQQVAARQQEPAENEPTSTVSEEPAPAGKPSASQEAEPEPGVLDKEAEEPEPEVLDSDGDKLEPELEVSESEGDKQEPEPEASDSEGDELELKPEHEVSDSEDDKLELELEDSDSEGDELELEPEHEVSDSEDDKLELELEDSDSEGDELELEPEHEVSDSEDDEPEPEVTDREGDDLGLVIGEPVESLSQWQPSVSVFRLPVSPPRPGCPLPRFRLVAGDAEDEFYLKQIEDTQSHAGDVTDDFITMQPSSPESPVTLVMVTCSACRSTNSSVICSFCGRGYHRDCHLPLVGPELRSEWMCSLCQDLSDPSDPFSSDRPPRPPSPCLSLQEQRKCESLLLHLKVEGCTRLPQDQLTKMSERLTLCRSPSYQTVAEFLSDIRSLFKDASQDDDVLIRLQDGLRCRWNRGLGPELRNTDEVNPVVNSNMSDGKQAAEHFMGSKVIMEEEEVDVSSESKLKEARKRLRELLGQVAMSRFKRAKTDKMAERQNL